MNTRTAQRLLHLGMKIGLSPSFLSFFRCFVMLNSAKNDRLSLWCCLNLPFCLRSTLIYSFKFAPKAGRYKDVEVNNEI